MIGIVVVSHSPALARAAVDLALQMGGGTPPPIRIAAGAGEGILGTDATAIAEAIEQADAGDGVVVVMDLGSALLSAEMAREFIDPTRRVVLSPAPFVEGLVSAVVLAAAGASLDGVAAEMLTAAEAKRAQLSAEPASEPSPDRTGAASAAQFESVVSNPSGLHARPAAAFVKTVGRYDADVRVTDLDSGGPSIAGGSLIALMALGVRRGTRVRVTATGPEASEAIEALRALVEDGFGER